MGFERSGLRLAAAGSEPPLPAWPAPLCSAMIDGFTPTQVIPAMLPRRAVAWPVATPAPKICGDAKAMCGGGDGRVHLSRTV